MGGFVRDLIQEAKKNERWFCNFEFGLLRECFTLVKIVKPYLGVVLKWPDTFL